MGTPNDHQLRACFPHRGHHPTRRLRYLESQFATQLRHTAVPAQFAAVPIATMASRRQRWLSNRPRHNHTTHMPMPLDLPSEYSRDPSARYRRPSILVTLYGGHHLRLALRACEHPLHQLCRLRSIRRCLSAYHRSRCRQFPSSMDSIHLG